mmetsp:Transcript_45681/g.114971  ORF Transcript_45681/g.114971 Transcript_45681/m.114971 type:complete len:490 (+) Transcript_45681:218-1687(+)|eukprot:CAMPEP_0177659354 /NCGR_PEP_ID=MMETSP0447-20121125/17396_1 /TAXON_ID=0 /ORGANISM="Stygamoeba regulata, Strain BSH-02190019" /LENGTH=489 /DNA_ID=CAMNT_0019164215 /DNA_START=207 /DNA_END=1676 /DNA_ORIENTATION=-
MRIFLFTALLLVAAAAAGEMRSVDVVIIGSGMAGLSAAHRLQKDHPGTAVLVLEALDTVGGRTKTMPVGSDLVSVGGTWLFPADHNALGLAAELGCEPVRDPYFLSPHVAPIKAILHAPLVMELWAIGRRVALQPGGRWWLDKDAVRLDTLSVDAWAREHVLATRGMRDALRQYFFALETMSTATLSTLQASVFLYHRFPFFNNTSTSATLEDALSLPSFTFRRWNNGTGVFVDCLHAAIGADNVLVSQPARHIEQSADGVVVTTTTGLSVKARYAIVAVNPTAAINTISYAPLLPEGMQSLAASTMATSYPCVGVVLTYAAPWWRALRTSGYILPDMTTLTSAENYFKTGVTGPVVELTPLEGDAVHGILRILTWPARVAGMSEAEVQQSACEYIASFYPASSRADAMNVLSFGKIDWSSRRPYLPGVTFNFNVGALTAFNTHDVDNLRTPHGRVHWAGTERATRGINWIEGAVSSGEAAAEAVGALL